MTRGLADRLRRRRAEIEQAALTRIRSMSDPAETPDPEYLDGLRGAVAAAVGYGIEAIERGEDRPPPVPTALLSQARLAARHRIKLETVLRRYLAGYTLLGAFLIDESEKSGSLNGAALKRLLRVQAALLDHVIAAVSEEYAREAGARLGSAERRLAERVEGLLAGRQLDISELPYGFDAIHQGAVADGPGAAEALRELAQALDCRLLLVPRGGESVWAWFGRRRTLDWDELGRVVGARLPDRVSLALGEPAAGVGGWRLTHRQAKAAAPIARRSSEPFTRYADVALPASMLQDDLLIASLPAIYLAPLSTERDGGRVMRETLRAYLAAGQKVSSAAAALGVNRHTVTSRLRAIEERLGRPLGVCAAGIEAALRLEDLGCDAAR